MNNTYIANITTPRLKEKQQYRTTTGGFHTSKDSKKSPHMKAAYVTASYHDNEIVNPGDGVKLSNIFSTTTR